nr:hypothetical protein [Brucella anthropi]DAM62843.1 MAG TPA: hypothetical protein [Caudoviricetes sp.]
MSFGAGLAGFVRGLDTGMSLREKWDAGKKRRANEAATKQINDNTKTAFAEAKAAGAVEDGDFNTFWTKYALPKQQALMLQNGDYRGAQALGEWGQSEDAKNGGKLFGSAMVKAQSGDFDGALQDAIAAGQLKGYINTDFTLTGRTPIEQDGKTIGYQLTFKDGSGKESTRNIRNQDIIGTIATYVNPEAAWKTQTDAVAAEKKRAQEREDYVFKKKTDKEFAPDKEESAEQKRYRAAEDSLAKSDLDWGERTEEERNALVRKSLANEDKFAADQAAKKNGGTTTPAATQQQAEPGRIIVDTESGKRVPIATPQQSKALGISEEAPVEKPAKQAPAPIPSNGQAPQSAPSGGPQANARNTTVGYAKQALAQGNDPERVKQQLLNAGVPEQEWPDELTKNGGGRAVGISF